MLKNAVAVALFSLVSLSACAGQNQAPLAEKALEAKSSDSSCPCSGSKLCTGPRGGRFCYTSGGNKRYIK